MIDWQDVRRALVRAVIGALMYAAVTLLGWVTFSWPAFVGAALLFPVAMKAMRLVILDAQHARKDEWR